MSEAGGNKACGHGRQPKQGDKRVQKCQKTPPKVIPAGEKGGVLERVRERGDGAASHQPPDSLKLMVRNNSCKSVIPVPKGKGMVIPRDRCVSWEPNSDWSEPPLP